MTRDDAELAVRYLEATKNDTWPGAQLHRASLSNVVNVWAWQRVNEAIAIARVEQSLKTPPGAPPPEDQS